MGRGRIALLLSACIGLVTSSIVVAPAAQASGWVSPRLDWTSNMQNVMRVGGSAYAHDFACGLKDCAQVDKISGYANFISGTTKPNRSKVTVSTRIDGVGVDVQVGFPAGVAAGFTDGGSTCDHAPFEASGGAVSVTFYGGVICTANTFGWVQAASLSIGAGHRFGSAWKVNASSAKIPLGAGG